MAGAANRHAWRRVRVARAARAARAPAGAGRAARTRRWLSLPATGVGRGALAFAARRSKASRVRRRIDERPPFARQCGPRGAVMPNHMLTSYAPEAAPAEQA